MNTTLNWSNLAEINYTITNLTNNITARIQEINYLKEQNEIWLYFFIVFTLAITAGIIIWYKIQEKKKTLLKNKIEEIKELIKTLESLENKIEITKDSKKTLKLRRIYLDDLPEELKEELKDKKHLLNEVFTEGYDQLQPYIWLMKNNGTIEIKKKVKEGLNNLESEEIDARGEKVKKSLNIKANKMFQLRLGNKKINVYTAHEDEAECYPLQTKHHSRALFDIVQSILLNRTGLLPKGKKMSKKLIIIIAVAILLAILGYWIYANYYATSPPIINAINETINQTAQNITNLAQNTTGTGNIKVVTIG